MTKPILLTGRRAWLTYRPPKKRDVRQAGELGKNRFWSRKTALKERAERVGILEKGGKIDRELADWMDVRGRDRAQVFCCPLVARKFQIYFTAQALRINRRQGGNGVLVTLFDPKRAVHREKLHKIDWRAEKAALAVRLKRYLGQGVVAIGIGDVEYDQSRRKWQPHFHLIIYGATEEQIRRLRLGAYFAKRGDLRPMLVSTEISIEGWFSYMSRLMPFRKLPNAERRVRLYPAEFRRYMRYLGRRDPASFIFRKNCRFERLTTS